MQSALLVAKEAKYHAAPNPMVGAVIVKDKKIIGTGFTQEPGKDHAEVQAIKDVKNKFGDQANEELKNSCLYVTLEPCNKQGKTPACTKAIINSGIEKVFIATKDPSQRGIEELRKSGIKVQEGICESESLEQNRGFFSRILRKRPFVTCKIACSIDGGIGKTKGEKKWITCKKAREDAHEIRASSDAILTGIGTVLSDNPRLTVRKKELRNRSTNINPKRYILDSSLKLKGDEVLLNDGYETTIFCNKIKQVVYKNPKIKIVEAPGRFSKVSLDKVMEYLDNQECNNLMIEAGTKINTSFIASKFIDEFVFYISPRILGKEKINFSEFESSFSNIGTIHLEHKEITGIGTDIKLVARPIYN